MYQVPITPPAASSLEMVNFPDPQVTSAQVHCGWGLLPILGLASERLNHPALLIVTVLKLWNAVGGLYM